MMSLEQTPINQLITDNIDTWTSTIKTKATTGRGSSKKLELYGVKKLRELILELAVRGKLVPQDPSDEPASVLLERIAAEKAQLVKDKIIKKSKALPVVSKEEQPFVLPKGWEWERLGSVGIGATGKTPSTKQPTFFQGSIPFIGPGQITQNGEILPPEKFLSSDGLLNSTEAIQGDILMVCIGGSIGKAAIAHKTMGFNQQINAIRALQIPSAYVYIALSTFTFLQNLLEKATGSATPIINRGKWEELLVPVAPVEEQHRIVAKVDELMTLCDQLELQTEASIEAHQVLVTTLLDTLTNSTNAEELMQNWQVVAENFDTLFTTDESIDQLKQTILQLAVMGKLVAQDPADEPATKLLERIAEEKAQLVKEKKIKKHPSVEPIGHVGVIPSSWKEIVVQDFADIRLGSTPSRHESKFWNGDIPWVSSGEVANGVIVDTAEKITQVGFDNSSTSIIPKRSLLMAIIGQGKTRGQTALLGIDACTNQNVAAFVFNEEFVIPEYVWLWAQSKYESHRQGGHGGAQPALNGKKVRSFAFPLPPTNEQMRIVAKVNALNLLCDQLKQCLRTSQQTQLQLTDAIVEQAL